MARVPDLPCAVCGKLTWRSRTSLPEGKATCNECRRRRAVHGTVSRYDRGCRCSKCRMVKVDSVREYQEARRSRGVPDAPPKRHYVEKTCAACGNSFQARVDNVKSGRGLYCSRRCANLAKLNLPWDSVPNPELHRRGHWIDLPDRLAIYERDNWTCHLCGLPVNPDADVQDGDYPTLDHLVPWSTQLVPDNSPSNLKCAHRSCNSRRGVMSVDEYRSRFGTRSAA